MEQFDVEFHSAFHSEVDEFSSEKFKKVLLTRNKNQEFNNWVVQFADVYSKIRDFTIAVGPKIEELRSAVSDGQDKVIALQDQLISSKEEQLAAVQSSVKAEVAGVQDAVKTEISSWSAIVQKKSTTNPQICPVALKKALRSAVDEEDRSRNLMIFGKEEGEDEEIAHTVAAVLEDLNEKPHVLESRRIGDLQDGQRRPIKIKLTSSDAVFQILRKARSLKSSANNKSTYIVRDRTKAERETHKNLVDQVKQKMKSQPHLYHYIRGEVVFSVKRND